MAGDSDRPAGRFHRARRAAARPGRVAVEVCGAGRVAGPARGLSRWLAAAAPARAAGAVSVAIVSDARCARSTGAIAVRTASPTCSPFVAGPLTPDPWSPTAESRPLGDIVIAAGRARRQAAEAGHSLATELRVLALHGLLHLLGYDHERDGGRMARVERALRRRSGLREGLIERVGAPARRGERRR